MLEPSLRMKKKMRVPPPPPPPGHVDTKFKKYINCGLSREIVACFCNVCKFCYRKNPYHRQGQFKDGYALNAINDVTCHAFPNPDYCECQITAHVFFMH